MNVNPGGKVPEMCDTIIPFDNPHGQGGKVQKMVFDAKLPDGHPYKQFEGLLKGMKIVLAEHRYTKDGKGKTLIGDYEESDMFGDDGNDNFAGEKSQLELVIKAAPGMFHPEMNPIKYFWAWIKRWFQERSNGNWQKAKDLVVQVLRLCPLATICQFFWCANHYACFYRLGATGPIAEFAVKWYHSHYGAQARDLDIARPEWEKRKAKVHTYKKTATAVT
ncbi:hypothetical protein DFH08DRAFT_824702 [Mycena albidolilacea]|uniref:Uncharacterized protein n=1 Tax=Mycena albidolilacea TaxID=1033008 RepID=A0AAD6Z3A7_9AGAR|nr:hypothetical protein DFH08DRAFT_824702 [Mycena albidolilacea]